MYYRCITLILAFLLVISFSNAIDISDECYANLTDNNENTTCSLNQTSTIITYENVINNMSIKLNISNETLFAFFNDITAPNIYINISDTEFINKPYLDEKLNEFSYGLQQVNSSVNIGLDNYLKTKLESARNETETLKYELNEKVDSLENRTARKIELSEMSDNLTNTIYVADLRLRNDLGNTLNTYIIFLFIAAIASPFGVFFVMTRFKPVKMRFLGSTEGIKHYISDIDHNPTFREKIKNTRTLKNHILKNRAYDPKMKIRLLEKIDKSEIDTETEIAKEAEIITLENKAKEAVRYYDENPEPKQKKK